MTPDEHAAEANRLLAVGLPDEIRGSVISERDAIRALTHAVLALRPGRPAKATVTAVPEVTATSVGAEVLVDRDGDIWAQVGARMFMFTSGHQWGQTSCTRDRAEEQYGPLVPLPQIGVPS